VSINPFASSSTDIDHLQEQRLYTPVYLIVYSITLCLLLFYAGVIEHKTIKTHRLTSIADFEYLHELNAQGMSCPCAHIPIPYNEFVTELRVQPFHQSCLSDFLNQTLTVGKHNRAV
jgi:hypothetical protein